MSVLAKKLQAPTASTPTGNDPPFQKVALLLHGDGTNGAQNNTFVDSSSNNFTITRTGNVAQGTFSPFSLAEGQWSNYFDGSGDYLSVPYSASLQLSGNQFTAEGWFYITTVGVENYIVSNTSGGNDSQVNWLVRVTSGNKLRILVMTSGITAVYLDGSTTVTANQWYHFAAVCDGSGAGATLKSWLNGVYQGTSSSFNAANINTNSAPTQIGVFPIAANVFYGYISNIRILKGTALYTGTSNITVPTAPLTAITNTSLLTCQSNRFKDNSSNNFTITRNGDTKVTAFSPFAPSAAYSTSVNGGSSYHNGPNTGSYLTVAGGASLGSGSFTIEGWIYPQAYNTGLFNTTTLTAPSGGSGQLYLGYYSASQLFINSGATGLAGAKTVSMTLPLNTWQHIAIVKNGSTLTIYVNGVSALSGADTFNYTDPNIHVGTWYSDNGTLLGYISNFRVVKGTAVYTSNFTPPTAPLTAISGTSLLLNCTDASIIDNSGKNDIETVGNAQISTSVKKYGTGSLAFDGTGDWLLMPANTTTGLTGDFTIEFWYNLNAVNSYNMLLGSSGTAPSDYIAIRASNIELGINNINYPTWTATTSSGTWYHLAVVRQSGTIKIYQNGTALTLASGSASNSTVFLPITQGLLVGKYGGSNGGGYPINGYIDDLRITKGQALYTANFTPPTQAFPNS